MAATVLPSHSPGRQIITNAGALAIGGIAAQAAFLFVEAMIARKLGVHAYGTFSAMYTAMLLIVLAIDLGMTWKLIELGARDANAIPVNLGTMLCLKALLCVVIYPLALAVLALSDAEPGVLELFAIFAAFGVLLLVQESLAAAYTAIRRNWFNALFQASVPLIIALAVAVVVLPRPSLNRTAWAYVLGSAIPTAIWAWLAIRRFAPRVDVTKFKETLRGSYLYGINALLSYSSFKTGMLVLMVFSTRTEVAFFAAAFKLVELGYKVPIVVNRVVAPHLFADSQHQPETFPALCEGLLRGAATLSALASFVLIVLGSELIHLIFGHEYEEAALLLQILGVALGLKTFGLIAQSVVTSAGRLEFRTRALAASITFGVVVSVPLVIQWGARGAAIGVLVADVTMLIALVWALRTVLLLGRVLVTVVAPIVTVAATLLVANRLSMSAAYAAAFGIAIIVAILFASGYLRPALRLASRGRR